MNELDGKHADLIPILGITEVAQMRLQDNLRAFFAAVGELMTTTYYTVLEEPLKRQWPFYCLISRPAVRWRGKGPSMYGYFADPGEASQETQACYGRDIVYVPLEQFRHLHLGQ